MNKKIVGGIGTAVVIAIIVSITISISELENDIPPIKISGNEKLGLVINAPTTTVNLQQLNEIYEEASSSGIGRSNVYLFWNAIEPEKNAYDWEQTDVLMSFNKKNNLKVSLYFSIINGKTLGPFPSWIGKPPIQSIQEDRLVTVLDAILSRYNIVDTVIISGETESHFRYNEQNIPVYKELFNGVYEKIKEKHPDVKIGNAFSLHHVLNKNLEHIVTDLAVGDFVAFSYMPVDSLNEIVKTPQEAKEDLSKTFDLAQGKKIAFFEVSWSSSDFVNGNEESQKEFLQKLFEFYSENESEIEFMTWYRQSDRPEGTCATEEPEIQGSSVSIGGGSGLGSSEYVIERLDYYICNAGLFDINSNSKSSWNEFKN
ncbi:MAG: hypothetical protein ACE5RJ_06030, partial [Nitrosopumilaceae archaeon]